MTAEKFDRKVILSTLWIFATLNYLYADVFSLFFVPGAQEEAISFTQGSAGIVLAFAFLLETAIAMTLFSRLLRYGLNRWANIIVAILHTAAVTWSLTDGTPEPFYIMFATVEIATTLFIIWYAWTWPRLNTSPSDR